MITCISLFPISKDFLKLGDDVIDDLKRNPTSTEIFQTVKFIGSLKAPRPNGYQALFFEKNWDVVGVDFCRFVKKVFHCLDKVVEVNQTFISLIPKKDEVSMMKDFRSIGLCNIVYKAITHQISQGLRSLIIDWSFPNEFCVL